MNLQIEYIDVDKLKLYKRNNKKHTDFDIGEIAKSIEKYGMNDPVGIWKDNVIIEGHGRVEACKKLGIGKVPCIRLDHLTDKERREYAILHNKTAELAEYDFDNLAAELPDLDFSDFDFDFGVDVDTSDETEQEEYETRMKEFQERMKDGELSEDDQEYQDFLAKFEVKKTTDDCYTPPIVYEAVADYVAERYGVNKGNFVRPFVPGGDYRAEKYKPTDIVVDNPPFSIMAEILTYYAENGIKFFLFAPQLTLFTATTSSSAACLICGVNITYENGAHVCTSFATNMEDCAFRSAPKLYKAIKAANDENLKSIHKELPKYSYPKNVITSSALQKISQYGIDFEVAKDECYFIRQLDAQKESGKAVFGAGYLISDRKKIEREAAEREVAKREAAEREAAKREAAKREAVNVFELSDRELDIIRTLKQ